MIECSWFKIVRFENIIKNLSKLQKLSKDLPNKDKSSLHSVMYSSFLDVVTIIKHYANDSELYHTLVPKSFKNGAYSMSWQNVAPALRRGLEYMNNLGNAYCLATSEPHLKYILDDWFNQLEHEPNVNINLMSNQLINQLKTNPMLKLPTGKRANRVLMSCGFYTNQNAIKHIKYGYKHGSNMSSILPAIKMIKANPNHIFFITYTPNGIADVRYNGMGTAEALDDLGVPGWKVLGLDLDGLEKILLYLDEQDVSTSQKLFNQWQKDTGLYLNISGKIKKNNQNKESYSYNFNY